MSPTRVVVVGAGWAGLAAAKTYLHVNPSVHLTIFDACRMIGGVWSRDRVYSGLVADSPSGLFNFSDMNMKAKEWEEIPAMKVQEYLSDYADQFHLRERMRLGTRVVKCIKTGDADKNGWVVCLDTGEEVACDKLIIATGLTSEPNMPDIPRADFAGPVIHSRDVGSRFEDFTRSGQGSMRNVTVYGGCKSAIDGIIMCLEAGKDVDWVVREVGQGNGPGLMFELPKPVFGISPFQFAPARWHRGLNPSIFKMEGWRYKFFQSGQIKLGFYLCQKLWAVVSKSTFKREPYKTDSENVRKLMPEHKHALRFTASGAALHGNKTFTDNLHEGRRLRVHRASIQCMSADTVQLSDGTILRDVDGAIFATGWRFDSSLFEPPISGLPNPVSCEDDESREYWAKLHEEADKDVLHRLPLLAGSPQTYERPLSNTPFRLYRYILPTTPSLLASRSLTFVGLLTTTQTAMYDEVSALWAVSWMEGLHDVPSKEAMDKDIATVNAWCARRYLARGKSNPIAAVEVQDVIDTLMKDLGLNPTRRKGWREYFLAYNASDYKGIVDEFLNMTRISCTYTTT